MQRTATIVITCTIILTDPLFALKISTSHTLTATECAQTASEEQCGQRSLSTAPTTQTGRRDESRRTQNNTPYLIVSQLAIEVVGGSDCRNHVGSLDEDRTETGTVKARIDGEIEFMIEALKAMDPTQSRCF